MSSPRVTPLEHMKNISIEYAERATAFKQLAVDAAKAEAEYRRVHAETMLRAMADGASAAKAGAVADADPVVASACLSYKTTAAVTDAASKKLSQLRSQLDYGRSVIASEREADRMHAAGWDGAA